MKKNKQNKPPTPGKPAVSPMEHDEALAQDLAHLALELAGLDERAALTDDLKKKKSDFQKIIRKCLHRKKDDILHEALERAQYDAGDAYRFLKDSIEEAAGIIVFRRGEGPDLEVNAFVIPLFAHTEGGLRSEQSFQDEQAFDLLRKSLQDAQLESADANVVLVSHAYHLDEIDRIGYSQLGEMAHEAFESMTRKKAVAAPAIAGSMSGWPASCFAPHDQAVELRFLLGFALKTMDDPFYQVPEQESAADRYFEARAARFQRWAAQAAPLLKRCLVTDGREIDIDFLYQDLFYGGKEAGIAEYYTLQMMADLQHALHANGIPAEKTHAVMGPAETAGETVLRVNLYAVADGALLASSDKPLGAARNLQAEADDAYDALTTIGVKSLALALQFDVDGKAVNARPYEN